MTDVTAKFIQRLRTELMEPGDGKLTLDMTRMEGQLLLHILQLFEDMRLQTIRQDKP